MNALRPANLALVAAVFLWGILMGGIVYSHMVFQPVFLRDLPESSAVVTGRYGLDESVFWMALHPVLILSLVASLALNWKDRARRKLLLIPAAVYLLALVVTFFYFVPELIAFAGSLESNLPKAEWMARGRRWELLSWIRGTLLGIAYVPLILSLTKRGEAASMV
jgi:hypothetical protein